MNFAAVMAKKARGTVSKFSLTKDELRNSHKHTLHTLAYYCFQPPFDHWLQHLLPQHSQLFTQQVDAALSQLLGTTLAPGALDCAYAQKRIRLPARYTGIGFRACSGEADGDFSLKTHAGFVGAASAAVAKMFDHASPR